MGYHVIDVEMMRIYNVSMELWRINEFASDLLVLKLASFNTVDKICCLKHEGISLIGVLYTTLYFVKINIYSVNARVMGYCKQIGFCGHL